MVVLDDNVLRIRDKARGEFYLLEPIARDNIARCNESHLSFLDESLRVKLSSEVHKHESHCLRLRGYLSAINAKVDNIEHRHLIAMERLSIDGVEGGERVNLLEKRRRISLDEIELRRLDIERQLGAMEAKGDLLGDKHATIRERHELRVLREREELRRSEPNVIRTLLRYHGNKALRDAGYKCVDECVLRIHPVHLPLLEYEGGLLRGLINYEPAIK